MKSGNTLYKLLFYLFCATTAIIILSGALQALQWSLESNGCQMTYMNPDYIKIPTDFENKKYELYYYREISSRQPTHKQVINYNGIPVLFVPGNSGSYKQVRSVASEADRIYHKVQYYYDSEEPNKKIYAQDTGYEAQLNHFDFFSINFHEELSAFSGDLLESQAHFVNECVKYILSLYQKDAANVDIKLPTSVILLGHSMGGVLTRSALSQSNYQQGSVHTIISLSSPQSGAVVLASRSTSKFYTRTNQYWNEGFQKNNSDLLEVSMVSIAGGHRDVLVRSSLSDLSSIGIPPTHGFTVLTTSIPSVWVQADHQCILWCNQVVKAITTALFKLVDPQTKQNTLPQPQRMKVLRDTFESPLPLYFGLLNQSTTVNISRTANLQDASVSRDQLYVDLSSVKFEGKSKVFSWTINSGKSFVMLSSFSKSDGYIQVYLTKGDSLKDAIDVTSHFIDIPFRATTKYGVFFLQAQNLQGYDRVFAIISKDAKKKLEKGSKQFLLISNEVDNNAHTIDPLQLLQEKQVNVSKNLFYHFSFPKQSKHYPITMTLSSQKDKDSVSLPFESISYQFSSSMKEEIFRSDKERTVLLFNQLPSQGVLEDQDLNLLLFLDPSREYQISFKIELLPTMGQLFHSYGFLVVGMNYVILLLILATQVLYWNKRGEWISLYKALEAQYFGLPVFVTLMVLDSLVGHKTVPQLLNQLGDHSFYSLFEGYPSMALLAICYLLSTGVLGSVSLLASVLFYLVSSLSALLPSNRFLEIAFIAIIGIAGLVSHGTIMLIGGLLLLLFSKNKKTENVRYSMFLFHLMNLALLGGSLIIWIKNLPWYSLLEWSIDSSTVYGLTNLIHILVIKETLWPIQSSFTLFFGYMLLLASISVWFFALFPFYRILDVLAVINVVSTCVIFLSPRGRIKNE